MDVSVARLLRMSNVVALFDILSEGDCDDDHSRGGEGGLREPLLIREQWKLVEEQRELTRMQGVVLEKGNVLFIKMTELLSPHFKNLSKFSGGRRVLPEVVPYRADPYLAKFH
ncbi:hypothetical protein ANCCAN_07967 [Ancylostoma caninum]|uniref:Uncharacterized protein n=1 Tax=Ancylostoma caninum TaxID=29170 RepID=A0A368GSL1_ANCCA|nr:hypothetical protein ANCCAN_07967 [Ancylostoma caninum]